MVEYPNDEDGHDLFVRCRQVNPSAEWKPVQREGISWKVKPYTGQDVAAKKIWVTPAETKSLSKHTRNRHAMMMKNFRVRGVLNLSAALIQTSTEVIILTIDFHLLIKSA